MKKNKRLFIFAAYSKDAIIDDVLVYYVRALSEVGDVVFIGDSDFSNEELSKIKPYTIYAVGMRHGEYDFGSYKRGYFWAKECKILEHYDWVYFVNDSVYGPLTDLQVMLQRLESIKNNDFVGMSGCDKENDLPFHVQSWFIGFRKKIVLQNFFEAFLRNVQQEPTKKNIVYKYEVRLSNLLITHGYSCSVLYCDTNLCYTTIYENPVVLLKNGVGFVKKTALKKFNDYEVLNCYCEFPEILTQIMLRINKNERRNFWIKYKSINILGIPFVTYYRRENSVKIMLFDVFRICKISETDRC